MKDLEPSTWIGLWVALFGASIGLSWLFFRIVFALRHRGHRLKPNALLRLSCTSGVFRTRLVSNLPDGLLIGAPLSRDSYVPLQPGERLIVESPCEGGVFLFRSHVISRDNESHTLLIEKPSLLRRIERRDEPRSRAYRGLEVAVNGGPGVIEDLSAVGARLVTPTKVCAGDVVRVAISGIDEVLAYALDVAPSSLGVQRASLVRVRFMDAIELPPEPEPSVD